MLLIGTLGTNFNEVLIEIHTFSFKNIHFKMSSGKWRPFCPGLNVLTRCMLHGRGSHHVSSIRLLTWVIISSDNSLPPVRRQAITYYFYQYWLIVSWTLAMPLCELFNRCVMSSQFPVDMKLAEISPVFKKMKLYLKKIIDLWMFSQ